MSEWTSPPRRRRFPGIALAASALTVAAVTVSCQAAPPQATRTRVVLLGTGTPNADPERQGPATAIVVDDRAYLVDAGTGIVRRAAQAARDLGIAGLRPAQLDRVFITHLHSDHTLGLPDLLLTPWVLERVPPLEVWGPPGTARMMQRIGDAWSEDIDIRLNGLEPHDYNPAGFESVVHEVTPGLVYQDDLVKVFAFQVKHGSWQYAYAYRFEGPDRVIVISGDTSPTDAIVEACNGCDVLVHEVYSAAQFDGRPSEWQRYHSAFHTSTVELADIAQRARPKLLVLYHQLFWGTDGNGLVREIRAAGYAGPVRSGRDLDVF